MRTVGGHGGLNAALISLIVPLVLHPAAQADPPQAASATAEAGATAAVPVTLPDAPPTGLEDGPPNVGRQVLTRRPPATAAGSSGSRSADPPASERFGRKATPHARPGDAAGWDASLPWYRSGLVSLAVVLAAIGGLALLLRRLVPVVRGSGGTVIEILARNPLAPKQSMLLVRVGRRVLLVGMSADRLQTLCQIDDAQEIAELLGRAVDRSPVDGQRSPGRFGAALTAAGAPFDLQDAAPIEPLRRPAEGLSRARVELHGLMAKLKSIHGRHPGPADPEPR